MYVIGPDGDPRPESDVVAWARNKAATDWAVAKTDVGDVRVSTVFLGVDHSFGGGIPILYKTMIFGGCWDQWQWRHPTRAAALAGHDRAVAAIRDGKTPDDVAAADAAGLLGLIQVIQRMLGGNAQAVSIDELLGVQAVVQSLRGAVDDEIARREAT